MYSTNAMKSTVATSATQSVGLKGCARQPLLSLLAVRAAASGFHLASNQSICCHISPEVVVGWAWQCNACIQAGACAVLQLFWV